MTPEPLRMQMMQLWADVFGDSESYISRIFSCWVDEGTSRCLTDADGRLAAMLCAHAFRFTGNLRGLYLHGLATRPDCRRRGLMARLIRECIAGAKGDYDFLFLVPASDDLRRYYARFGFLDSAPSRFVMAAVDSDSLIPAGDDALSALQGCEERQPAGSIIHSMTDLAAVADEWHESGGQILATSSGTVLFRSATGIICANTADLLPASCNPPVTKVYLFPATQPSLSGQVHSEPYAMVLPLRADLPRRFAINLLMD